MLYNTCFICCENLSDSVTSSFENTVRNCLLKSLIDVLGISYSTFTGDLLEQGNFEEVNDECYFCNRCCDSIVVGVDLKERLTAVKKNLIEAAAFGYQKRLKHSAEAQLSETAELIRKLANRLGECFTENAVVIRPDDGVPVEKLRTYSEPTSHLQQEEKDISGSGDAEFNRSWDGFEPEEELPPPLAKRKRGRPRKSPEQLSRSGKNPKSLVLEESDSEVEVLLDEDSGSETDEHHGRELLTGKRKRGRPRKIQEVSVPFKKKRGRPPKQPPVPRIKTPSNSRHVKSTGRKPGRPRKNASPSSEVECVQWTSHIQEVDLKDPDDDLNETRLRPRTSKRTVEMDSDLSDDSDVMEVSDKEIPPEEDIYSDESSDSEYGGRKVNTRREESNGNNRLKNLGSFLCNTCGKTFRRQKNLQKHLATKHPSREDDTGLDNLDAERDCFICGYACSTSYGMYVHERDVHNLRSFARFDDYFYSCFTCLTPFTPSDPSELPGRLRFEDLDKLKEFAVEHDHCKREPVSQFRCSKCEDHFALFKNLLKHARQCYQNVKKYPCIRCPSKFDSSLDYLHHLRQEHEDRVKLKCQCYKCGGQFQDLDSLRKHILDSSKLLRCPGCGQNFQGSELYGKHGCKLDQVPEPQELVATEVPSYCTQLFGGFPCLSCDKIFDSVPLLALHFQEHHDKIQDLSFNCGICSTTLTSSETLDKKGDKCFYSTEKDFSHPNFTSLCSQHLKTCKSDGNSCFELAEPSLECQVCSEYQESPQALGAHLNEHYGVSEVHQCPGCTLVFSRIKDLRFHLKSNHNVRLWLPASCYYCGECQQAFQSNNPDSEQGALAKKDWDQFHYFLERHFQCKADKIPPKCKYCPAKFTVMTNLFNHEIRMHTKNYLLYCESCGKGCANQGELHSHMKTHEVEKGDRSKPTCHICGKSFCKKDYLQQHLTSHEEEGPPMVCQHCGKGFHIKQNLIRHERNHLRVKPTEPTVPCTICGKLFTTVTYMKYHIIYNHEKRPRAKSKPSPNKAQRDLQNGEGFYY